MDGRKTTAEKAEILADAGFNTARCAADQIDDFASAGLMVLMKVPESLPKFTDSAHFERWDRMYRKGMQKYLKHPSLIGYCNTDEPAWRGVASAPVVEAYEYIRKIDPYRPVMLNEAPRGKIADLRSYAAACDTYGVDIYPVPSPNPHSGLDDKTMTCVGRYADLCREVVRDRKPVWMTLQGFAWGMVTHKSRLSIRRMSRIVSWHTMPLRTGPRDFSGGESTATATRTGILSGNWEKLSGKYVP